MERKGDLFVKLSIRHDAVRPVKILLTQCCIPESETIKIHQQAAGFTIIRYQNEKLV